VADIFDNLLKLMK